MFLNKNIGIIGGDLRIIRLAEMLAEDGYIIYAYALENYNLESSDIIKCKSIEEIYNNCDNIISGIPLSKDGIYLNTPFSDEKLKIEELLKKTYNKKLIAGSIKQEIREKAKENEVDIIDLMDEESLTILNVIPTVEGAIQIAMENTEFTIHNSNCLVLGFGRIGKLLTKELNVLGANVTCMARKDKDLAWLKAYNYNGIHINNLNKNLEGYDIIFNTIPAMILDGNKIEVLRKNNKNVLIIDLASNPGGVDKCKAEECGINVIHALGLPGKVAPQTAAKYIKQSIYKILD